MKLSVIILLCSCGILTNTFPMGSIWLKREKNKPLISDLTEVEKNQMFPGFQYFTDDNSFIVRIDKHKINRKYDVTFNGAGITFRLHVTNSENVLFAKSVKNSYQTKLSSLSSCIYNGEAYISDTKNQRSGHGLVTVNLCKFDKVHGEIMSREGSWTFYTLPQRFQRKSSNRIKLLMVYIDSSKNRLGNFSTRCGVEDSKLGRLRSVNETARPISSDFKTIKNVKGPVEKEKRSNSPRITRQSRTHVIELAIFIDVDMFKSFNQNEDRLIDAIIMNINSVQLILSQQEFTADIRLLLVNIGILTSSDLSRLQAVDNAEQYIANFGEFQSVQNPPDIKGNGHWDHAILLTGINLVNRNAGTSVLGISYLEGMCNPVESVSLVEGTHPLAATIVAHEIGHSIGSDHDGFNNICIGGIMSPTLGPDQRQYRWSDCSNEMINRFLSSNSRSGCLLEA